ncbi:MAG: hypothetical protein ACFFDC_00980 [Promethearchaeota archaeon]
MVKSNPIENSNQNGIVGKWLQNKHILLVYIGAQEEINQQLTVVDIKKYFHITKKYAWNLLEKLEEEVLIQKGEKVSREGKDYHSYILTAKAKQELKVISLYLSNSCTFCQISPVPECPYSTKIHNNL